jgi:hypothetical protein
MTAGGVYHLSFTVQDHTGRETTIGVNVQDGYVVFSNLPRWFKVPPDVADNIAAAMGSIAAAARRQQEQQGRRS